MLKPHYGRIEKGKNYKIGHFYGNSHFDSLKTRGIHQLLVNGYDVMFIPNYDFNHYSFPPSTKEIERILKEDRKFKSIHERRLCAFYFVSLVFFEYPEKEGENFIIQNEYENDEGGKEENICLIHCINSKDFKLLTHEMRVRLPQVIHKRNLQHHIRHDEIADLKHIKFLDQKFIELKDKLPKKLRESLEI